MRARPRKPDTSSLLALTGAKLLLPMIVVPVPTANGAVAFAP